MSTRGSPTPELGDPQLRHSGSSSSEPKPSTARLRTLPGLSVAPVVSHCCETRLIIVSAQHPFPQCSITAASSGVDGVSQLSIVRQRSVRRWRARPLITFHCCWEDPGLQWSSRVSYPYVCMCWACVGSALARTHAKTTTAFIETSPLFSGSPRDLGPGSPSTAQAAARLLRSVMLVAPALHSKRSPRPVVPSPARPACLPAINELTSNSLQY